jgi:hypothetical protein
MVVQLLEALCYKLEGNGSDSEWGLGRFFNDLILPVTLWPPRLTWLLTEISTRNLPWGGRGGQCVGLTPCHLHVPTENSGNLSP